MEFYKTLEFSKRLAKFYHTWLKNCVASAEYCNERGQTKKANEYLKKSEQYATLIKDNLEAIDFFSQGDNAFLKDEALPQKFRGYK